MFKRKRGAESTWLAPALSAGFGAGATAAGFGIFAPAASAFGGFLGQKFKDVTGYGDYTVRQNSLLSGSVPSVGNPSNSVNGTTISHKEFLGDVITSGTAGNFSISSFVLNPANPQCWEWLAQIAVNYEEWKPEGILFYFKTTSTDALSSTNTALGQVTIATNYNPYNAAFTSLAEMQSYEYCTNGVPSEDLVHMIECDPREGAIATYYMSSVNSAANAGLQDQRFNTLGTTYIATSGFQAASVNIGQLWVTYQVTLLKPKLYQSLGLADDYLQVISTNVTDSFNGIFQIPLGTVISSKVTMPFSGSLPSGSAYLDQAALAPNSGRIHFPMYPFGTSYIIYIVVTQPAGLVPLWTLAPQGVAYPANAQITFQNNFQFPAPATAGISQWSFFCQVNVPGGYMYKNGVASPSLGITSNMNMSNFTYSMFITQQPYVLNVLSLPSPP
nr:MAG: capsid protein [Army ant associated crucivirus 1]WAX26096.1 MAG: capsid protein [Army ant associated crucivirus 1]